MWTVDLKEGEGKSAENEQVGFKGNFCPPCPRLKGFFTGPGKFKQKESELCQSISIVLVMNYQLLPEQ